MHHKSRIKALVKKHHWTDADWNKRHFTVQTSQVSFHYFIHFITPHLLQNTSVAVQTNYHPQ